MFKHWPWQTNPHVCQYRQSGFYLRSQFEAHLISDEHRRQYQYCKDTKVPKYYPIQYAKQWREVFSTKGTVLRNFLQLSTTFPLTADDIDTSTILSRCEDPLAPGSTWGLNSYFQAPDTASCVHTTTCGIAFAWWTKHQCYNRDSVSKLHGRSKVQNRWPVSKVIPDALKDMEDLLASCHRQIARKVDQADYDASELLFNEDSAALIERQHELFPAKMQPKKRKATSQQQQHPSKRTCKDFSHSNRQERPNNSKKQ